MALSKFIALFFALAVLAATLQLSQARVQGLNSNQEEEQYPKLLLLLLPPAGAEASPASHCLRFPDPRFPVSTIVRSTPRRRSRSAVVVITDPAPPAECLTPLMGMAQCMDYLTNITVATPPGKCCDGLKSVIISAPICLCHGMNGGMSKLAPKPIDPIRMLILSARCGTMIPIQKLFMCATQPLPPLTPPTSPTPPASPVFLFIRI
ncbi:hypothetical protein BRADI_3g48345v3 [Brachypodium distachyon]|uniref:Bifunctional inhibitor/plant lipid transfer protein/seed storage helical domain-containing protein n=1 Tax=Brachypodium distachyon TaxID=15368 RepID=A0A2K2D427_BRADI|nr:hypothetical protein BRADI_3g48345v3 [Brachypodium distachyon]